ncbi:MAG: hypothetical protein QNJ97_25075 [Myxococcota bacterium]|nr:hypothetical protein [Myxococcota bacterium]
MSSTQPKFQAAVLTLGVVLVVACGETTGSDDNQGLSYCTLDFTNETGFLIDHAQFFPTDFLGILTEIPDLPIAPGDTRTVALPVGVYQMKVNNSENHYYFTSFDHRCIKDQILEVTATIEDIKVGMLEVVNKSGFNVTSVLLASTDDLIFGDNLLASLLDDGEEILISTDPGRFYWLIEDEEGNTYFSSTHVYGSVDGLAIAHPEFQMGRKLCTLTLTNSTGITLDYIYIVVPGQEIEEGVWYISHHLFDSRGNLPSSEALDILIAPGTWTLGAYNINEDGDLFEISGLVCSDGLPLTATVAPEDVQ